MANYSKTEVRNALDMVTRHGVRSEIIDSGILRGGIEAGLITLKDVLTGHEKYLELTSNYLALGMLNAQPDERNESWVGEVIDYNPEREYSEHY